MSNQRNEYKHSIVSQVSNFHNVPTRQVLTLPLTRESINHQLKVTQLVSGGATVALGGPATREVQGMQPAGLPSLLTHLTPGRSPNHPQAQECARRTPRITERRCTRGYGLITGERPQLEPAKVRRAQGRAQARAGAELPVHLPVQSAQHRVLGVDV